MDDTSVRKTTLYRKNSVRKKLLSVTVICRSLDTFLDVCPASLFERRVLRSLEPFAKLLEKCFRACLKTRLETRVQTRFEKRVSRLETFLEKFLLGDLSGDVSRDVS